MPMSQIDQLTTLLPQADAAYEDAYYDHMQCTSTTVPPFPNRSLWKARWLHGRGVVVLPTERLSPKAERVLRNNLWELYDGPTQTREHTPGDIVRDTTKREGDDE